MHKFDLKNKTVGQIKNINQEKQPEQNIKNNEGRAAASSKSWDAQEQAFVANVSKLNGLRIKVSGNSFNKSINSIRKDANNAGLRLAK